MSIYVAQKICKVPRQRNISRFLTARQTLLVSAGLVGIRVDAVRVVENHVVLQRVGARGRNFEYFHCARSCYHGIGRGNSWNNSLNNALSQSESKMQCK